MEWCPQGPAAWLLLALGASAQVLLPWPRPVYHALRVGALLRTNVVLQSKRLHIFLQSTRTKPRHARFKNSFKSADNMKRSQVQPVMEARSRAQGQRAFVTPDRGWCCTRDWGGGGAVRSRVRGRDAACPSVPEPSGLATNTQSTGRKALYRAQCCGCGWSLPQKPLPVMGTVTWPESLVPEGPKGPLEVFSTS